ncbi:MAG: Holliday junction resolvase RuvX [Chloroflexi bacterium]|nr:Holliday junction resolvase RuvX [Chloroflexota bacterium]
MEDGRVLGIDPGERRVGLAVSDALRLIASPLQVLPRGRDLGPTLEAIARIAREERAVQIVVGYPINADGSIGPQARRSEEFARRLGAVLALPMQLWDERLSSAGAEEALRANGRDLRRARQRGELDAYAAAVMLQDYLDAARLARTRAANLAALESRTRDDAVRLGQHDLSGSGA